MCWTAEPRGAAARNSSGTSPVAGIVSTTSAGWLRWLSCCAGWLRLPKRRLSRYVRHSESHARKNAAWGAGWGPKSARRTLSYPGIALFSVKRYPFLDWTRGLAVVIMIQCHAFNSFTRLDLHDTSGYVLTQFVGGMAAPLFLFMAGMTFGFLMEGLEARGVASTRRWWTSMRRAGYVLALAYAFRLTNWLGSFPNGSLEDLTKVDILNCMGLALALFSTVALANSGQRVQYSLVGAVAVAIVAPLVGNLEWTGLPLAVR